MIANTNIILFDHPMTPLLEWRVNVEFYWNEKKSLIFKTNSELRQTQIRTQLK